MKQTRQQQGAWYKVVIIKTRDGVGVFKSRAHHIEAWGKGLDPVNKRPIFRPFRYADYTDEDKKEFSSYTLWELNMIRELGEEARNMTTVGKTKKWLISKSIGNVAPIIEVEKRFQKVYEGDA